MLAFPGMLAGPAKQAGISVPDPIPDDIQEFKETHRRFFLFCVVQLGQSLPHPTAHWNNAEVMASIPEDKLETITVGELLEAGLQIGTR